MSRSFERTVKKNSKQLNQQRKKVVNQSQVHQVKKSLKDAAFCSYIFDWPRLFVSVYEHVPCASSHDNLGLGDDAALRIFGSHLHASSSIHQN